MLTLVSVPNSDHQHQASHQTSDHQHQASHQTSDHQHLLTHPHRRRRRRPGQGGHIRPIRSGGRRVSAAMVDRGVMPPPLHPPPPGDTSPGDGHRPQNDRPLTIESPDRVAPIESPDRDVRSRLVQRRRRSGAHHAIADDGRDEETRPPDDEVTVTESGSTEGRWQNISTKRNIGFHLLAHRRNI